MNKKVVGTLVLAMTAGAALLPLTAQATGVAETGVGIGFNSGPNTIIPGPYDDQLSLMVRPTAFQFGGTNATSETTKAYNQEEKAKQYIAAFEDRPTGEIGAWKLNAQLSKLTSGSDELAATLNFNTKKISTFEIKKDENGMLPTTITALPVLTDYTGTTVTGIEKVSLEAGADESVMIIDAKADAGTGGFAAEVRNVQLLVTGKQDTDGKTFNGTVTWSLDDLK